VPAIPSALIDSERFVFVITLSKSTLARPDLRRAASSAVVALVLVALLAAFGDPQSAVLSHKVFSFAGALAFAIAAAIGVRSAANEISRVAALRAGPGTASGLRLGLTVLGYLVIVVVALTVLRVPVEKLLLSGAITGVVIGIAAQQALANLFAGLVLLTSRPFQIGESIILRSGALGGEYSGRVIGIGLAYTELLTEDGPFSLPNAGVLAAAVGPRRGHEPPHSQDTILLAQR
jgi:small-conductance mechanosensitive channel